MAVFNTPLHWHQRVALVRYNLHTASRSGDFAFFKAVQAAALMDGTNHVASLSAILGEDADMLLAAMDNLNAGLAYAHQDAFKVVYDNLKSSMLDNQLSWSRSDLFVDIIMQKNAADTAIDRMLTSAVTLINRQPESSQDTATSIFITGASLIADAIHTSVKQMDALETNKCDFIRMEESWNTVKTSVACAVAGLRGIFSLIDSSPPASEPEKRFQRPSSIASASSTILRRFSDAFGPSNTNPVPLTSLARRSSIFFSTTPAFELDSSASLTATINTTAPTHNTPTPAYRTPNCDTDRRTAYPPSRPNGTSFDPHLLSPIPPTPANYDMERDPFDTRAMPVASVQSVVMIL